MVLSVSALGALFFPTSVSFLYLHISAFLGSESKIRKRHTPRNDQDLTSYEQSQKKAKKTKSRRPTKKKEQESDDEQGRPENLPSTVWSSHREFPDRRSIRDRHPKPIQNKPNRRSSDTVSTVADRLRSHTNSDKLRANLAPKLYGFQPIPCIKNSITF